MITVVKRIYSDILRTHVVMWQVKMIALAGQMHGVVLWKRCSLWKSYDHKGDVDFSQTSHLYTWQDARCSQQFLDTLPEPDGCQRASSGYGCATLFWLQQNRLSFLTERKFDCAGTIMDLFVAAVSDLNMHVTSYQLASSFGYFNIYKNAWNKEM